MAARSICAALVLLLAAACGGGSSGSQPQGPNALSVSVQPGDVPKSLVKCDLSGDIATVVSREATPDPSTSQTFQKDWQEAQSKGAKDGYAAFYASSTTNCAAIKSSSTNVGTASYPLLVNFVVMFKDEKSASDVYTTGTLFNFSASTLKKEGAPVTEGTNTGLGANSVVLSASIGDQSFYVAEWQHKAFVIILVVLNLDAAASKKVATAEDSRIT
jgi:hypothetical protein